MKRVLVLVVVMLAATVLPSAAPGKGASEATIVGPGLEAPIALRGSGEPGSGAQLGEIAEASGFFAAVFPQTPDPMLARRPAGVLGPRYTITYTMPGPDNVADELVQHVYPYAQPHPVTYVQPGQRFWTTERTRGGWYVASYSSLKDQLVAAGLPATAPRADLGGGGFPWLLATLATVVTVVGLALLGLLYGKRRPRPAPA